jgi:hypothetical protein
MPFFVSLTPAKAPPQGLPQKAKRLDASMEPARRAHYRGAFFRLTSRGRQLLI